MKLLLPIIFICYSINSYSQCDNIKVNVDKFEKTVQKYAKDPLLLVNNWNNFKISISGTFSENNKNYSYVTLSCVQYDKNNSLKNFNVGLNSGFIFLFSDGTTLKLYNDCLKASSDSPRVSNSIGCLTYSFSLNPIDKTDKYIVDQLLTKSISSIRLMDIEGNNIDFNLDSSQSNHIKNILNCFKK